MKKRCIFMSQTIAIAGCLASAASGFADGKIIIQPKIETGAEYNSNYWKAKDQEVSVTTYYAKPGIVFGYETPKTKIDLDSTVDGYWYDDQDTPPPGVRDAGDDDYFGFTGELIANHQLTDRLNLDFADKVYVTRDPARADANSNSISRDRYTINYLEPGVYYEFADKFGIRSKYRNTVTDYEQELEDSTEHRGIFDLYYNLNKSSAFYLDYQVWQRNYDQESTDYLSNQITLNYETKFNYFKLVGGGGYHRRNFDSDTLDDLDLFSWKIEIKGQDPDSTPKTTRSRLSLAVGQEMNDDGTGDQYLNSTFVRFEGGYRLFHRLEASLKASYQNSNYETDNREDDTYFTKARLEYQAMDFMAVGIEGGLETRDSNFDGNSYDDTFVAVTLSFNYDFGSR